MSQPVYLIPKIVGTFIRICITVPISHTYILTSKTNIIVNCIVLLYNFSRCGLSRLSINEIYLIEIDHDNISQNERRHDLCNDKMDIHIL